MSFLTAEWRKLAIANYVTDPQVLAPYLPVGTELDLWNGNCYISLIGFLFKNTRLMGYYVPFHANFEEVNLRFYVKYNDAGTWKRGVVFIREFVPRFALSVVANVIYNENYLPLPMTHKWEEGEDERTVTYKWRRKGQWQGITINAQKELSAIEEGSEAEFITEHYWGYARYSNRKTNEYEVKHPKWAQYQVNDYTINVDFALNYGAHFAFMNALQPASVMLAEGSDISVENKRRLVF